MERLKRTKRLERDGLMHFSAYYFYRHQVFFQLSGDLRWRRRTINMEYAESTVVNVPMAMGESR